MGISPLMSLGVRAMSANYAALQATGHNIANANTEGYSRQEVEFRTAQGQFSGSGFFGRGVDVATVSRAHNEFLTREAATTRSLAAMDATRLEQLGRLQNVFKSGESGVGYSTSQMMNALVDLSSRPSDLATRQVVLARAADLASRFNEAGMELEAIQSGLSEEIKTNVAAVNGLTRSIAEANRRIVALSGAGHTANDVLDERERLISRLSEHVQVTRIEADDGTLGIFAGGGQRLVLGYDFAELTLVQDPSDSSRAAVAVDEFGSQRILGDASLGGGSLAGLLQFQNIDLVAGRTLMGRLAAAIGGALNEQQMRGINLQTPLGTVPSSPLFTLPTPQAVANAANVKDAFGNPVGSVDLVITAPADLQASEYELAEDPANAGQYLLKRLLDGKTSTVASGDVVDGFQINFGVPGPQPGDRFLLQPVSGMSLEMRPRLTDPRDVAAASALLATTGAANVGTVTVQAFKVTAAPLPVPGASARITFTDNVGGYQWELRDAGNALLSSGTGAWTAGQPVPAPPLDINGFSIDLTGAPRLGDTVDIRPTPNSALATNNGNALVMQSLRDAPLVAGRSATDAFALALSDIGVRVQTGQTAAAISSAVRDQSEVTRSSQSGVNLDEEAARLIQFQQSYQAAAKMLQVAQSVFDTLIQATSR